MASSLISNQNSKSQYQANLLTNRPNLVKVLVEDEIDVVVWQKILTRLYPSLAYEVTPYSTDPSIRGKGKANIIKHSDQFGPHMIGCVDSDDDWLLCQWSAFGTSLKNNPYILQTYAYSIENLAAQPYGNSECMLECTLCSCDLQRYLDIDYRDFLNFISVKVYDILIWHLLLVKEGIDINKNQLGWAYVFGNDIYSDIIKNNALSIEDKRILVLKRFSGIVNNLQSKVERKYENLKEEKYQLQNYLESDYGLNPDNSYLFVRGHDLQSFLLYTFFAPVKLALVRRHIDDIKSKTFGNERRIAIEHYHNLLKDFEGDYIRKVNYIHDTSNTITQRIADDIIIAFSSLSLPFPS